MIDQYVLDEDGNPVEEPDLMKWGLWMEKRDVRRVALTPFAKEVELALCFSALIIRSVRVLRCCGRR